MRHLSPSLLLFLFAPAIGELLSGSSPPLEFFFPPTLILLALMYGCGALVCRELVIRWGKGWLSLLLLGLAYGIYEEGIVVRSSFNPGWQDLDNLAHYGRWAGVNWVWIEHLTHYHALISILASITLVEIVFPDRQRERWLGRRAWRACWLALIGWIPLEFLAFPYRPPLGWYALTWLTVLGLIWAARRLPARRRACRPARAPSPTLLGIGIRRAVHVLFHGVCHERPRAPCPSGHHAAARRAGPAGVRPGPALVRGWARVG
jgi:hypothetical protein